MDRETKMKLLKVVRDLKRISNRLEDLDIDSFSQDINTINKGIIGIIVNEDVAEMYGSLGGA